MSWNNLWERIYESDKNRGEVVTLKPVGFKIIGVGKNPSFRELDIEVIGSGFNIYNVPLAAGHQVILGGSAFGRGNGRDSLTGLSQENTFLRIMCVGTPLCGVIESLFLSRLRFSDIPAELKPD